MIRHNGKHIPHAVRGTYGNGRRRGVAGFKDEKTLTELGIDVESVIADNMDLIDQFRNCEMAIGGDGRLVRIATVAGRTRTAEEWARELGCSRITVNAEMRKGRRHFVRWYLGCVRARK